jgi:ParB/RepB/Spo0J family partition protein
MTETEEVFYLDPLTISVKEGLDRYRKDLGDLEELGKSLKELGQIQPIVINRKNELIVGGRRLAACILQDIKVKAIYEDMVEPIKMRTWELEENLRRKELTPAEYSLAVDELHSLMQQQRGTATSGREGGHTLDDTAKILGKTRGSVISELEMAEMIKAFPELKSAKKKSEIKSAAKGLQKLNAAMTGLKEYEKQVADGNALFKLHHMDAVGHMQSLPDGCKDILLTDPLYGIGADEMAIGLGGHTGGALTSAGYRISDEVVNAITLLKVLAKESFRFTTSRAHGYVFCGPEHFWNVRSLFLKEGWRVHVKPIIWIKREVGQCNVPTAWPASCYEMLIYIRKDESRLVKEGQPDWIECTPVLSDKKLHPFEKPIPLLLNLLERVAIPGQQLYDPFMGCAPVIEAGLQLKLICEGVDISLEAYATAMKRIKEYMEDKE